VGLLIVVTSLFGGFIESYLEYSEGMLGDVVLMPGAAMAEYEELAEHLEKLPTVAWAMPVVQTGGLLYLGRGDVRAVQVLGLDLEKRCEEDFFRRGLLLQGASEQKPSFALSAKAKTAARLWMKRKRGGSDAQGPVGAVVGIGILAQPDELTDKYDREEIIKKHLQDREGPMIFTTGRQQKHEEGEVEMPTKKNKPLWPIDAVQTGMNDFDTRFVYLPFDYVRELVGIKDADGKVRCLARVQITAQEDVASAVVVEQVLKSWRTFAFETLQWPQEEIDYVGIYVARDDPGVQMFTREIRKQLWIWQLILGLICLVAALLILVVLFMIVLQKKQDIGIIRSLGASRSEVAQLFLWYGAGIGSVGALLGLVLGIWATQNINMVEAALAKVLGFKIWKSGVYMFSEIPNEVAWSAVIWIVIAGVGSAVLGALLPAIRAAKLEPAEAMRYE